MKLRNKKTGEIVENACIGVFNHKSSGDCERIDTEARSLEKVLEEWEDYTPIGPLIKDEKIRKAVRAWAEALGLQEVYCASNGYEIYGGIDDWVIQFDGEPFPFADKNKVYTIAELCGTPPEPIEPTFVDLDERIKEKEEE